jgi:hypothetical protein
MIILKGKADNVSREQVRAFLYASLVVLGYHNRAPRLPLVVRIKKRLEPGIAGTCLGSYIELKANLDVEVMLTTCVHEVIHACIGFPDATVEKCTSTLCAKIKPDVEKIARLLVDGTYKRAAYIAHTKIHYPVKEGQPDTYDQTQYKPIGVKTKYHRGR